MSVFVSAITAAFVTLAIEWFAKPWLEVRKDRILDQRRNLRRLQELAESGSEAMVSLSNIDFHHSHPNRANNAMRPFRQELTTLKYGLSKNDRRQAEELAKVSASFTQDSTRENWMDTFEQVLLAYALFRYSRSESKAFHKLIETGAIKEPDQ